MLNKERINQFKEILCNKCILMYAVPRTDFVYLPFFAFDYLLIFVLIDKKILYKTLFKVL